MRTDTPPSIYLADYQPSPFLIDHVDMHVRLDGADTKVTAQLKVRRNPASHLCQTETLELNLDEIETADFEVNGTPVSADLTASFAKLALHGDGPWQVSVATTLDPSKNTALSGLYLSNGVYCTQCEAEGFRRIIPFLDRPDVLATYTVTIDAEAAAYPTLLANGNLVAKETLDEGWHRAVWTDPHPKPSYLFALVAGDLDVVRDSWRTSDGRDVDLAIYVERGKAGQTGFAMEALKRSMAWDEKRFGRTYDLDVFNIVAVSDFNLGAMENKGLNIFNDKYILASPETATDDDYQRIDAIIAHEYFHNWSGNRVTCRDWFQLCLKEGLTVYRDQEYTSDTYDRTIKRISDVRQLWAHQFPEDAGPLAHPVRPDTYREINNFYTATVYEKGAEIVRMVAEWLGPEAFRSAMDRYFETYDGTAATLEDFLDCMAAEREPNSAWPNFLRWYQQAGTPQVEVTWVTNNQIGSAELRFKQTTAPTPSQDEKTALPIPCRLALVGADGQDEELTRRVATVEGGRLQNGQFLLEEDAGRIVFSDLPETDIRPSLFRDYSAPVSVAVDGLCDADRLFLAARDSNPYNRWAQLQALASQALQRRYHRLLLDEPTGDDCALLDALIETALSGPINDGDDQSTRAASLTLPTAHDIARSLEKDIDPDCVVAAHASLSRDLCERHGDKLTNAILDLDTVDDGSISPQSAARRSLIASVLQHLAHSADGQAHILQAYEQSIGMTMRIKSLALLVKHEHPEAKQALADFERRFGSDPLAMDKWFAVQASHGSAADIERLEGHEAYDRANPNRVRSLVGAFAANNLAGFHAKDGSGYALLTERIRELDGINPQLAARLATSLRTWSTMETERRDLAREAMQNLKDSGKLSPDTSDILLRMLSA